jgi:tRNA threonylcarbamoyladenosine biosynthesis protein TsaB
MPDRSVVLAIETSGRVGGAGLYVFEGGALSATLFERVFERGLLHGSAVVPSIREALRGSGISGPELALISVSAGPGSWTGLRIGVTVAKTLALAWKVPLAGVSSLEALAWKAAEIIGSGGDMGAAAAKKAAGGAIVLAPIRDAKRDEVYAAAFRLSEGSEGPTRLFEDRIVPLEELAEIVPTDALVFGDVPQLREKLVSAGIGGVARLIDSPSDASLRGTAILGIKAVAVGEALTAAEKIHAFAPRYLKLSHPERKLRERIGDRAGRDVSRG